MRKREQSNERLTSGERRDAETATGRRRYVPPSLVPLGDLRTLTLGGSPGAGDSSSPLTQNPRT